MRALLTSLPSALVFLLLIITFTYADLIGLENAIDKAYKDINNGDTTKFTKGSEMMKAIATHSVEKTKKSDKFYTNSVSSHVDILVSYEYTVKSMEKLDAGIKSLIDKSKPNAEDHKWMALALDNIGGVHCRDVIQWYTGSRPAKCPTSWNRDGSYNEVQLEKKKKSPSGKFYYNRLFVKSATHVTKTKRTSMLYIVIDIAPKVSPESKESPEVLKTKRNGFRKRIKNIKWSKDKAGIVKEIRNIHKDFMKFCLDKGIGVYVKDIRELAEKFVEDTGGDVEEKVQQFEVQKNAGFTATDKLQGKIFATKSAGDFAKHAMAHEVMHLLSAEDGKTPFFKWHNSVNEGATDYLTRIVFEVKAKVEDRFYMQQAQMMQALSEKSDDAFRDMARIYFSVEENADVFMKHFKSEKKHIIESFGGGDAPRFEKVTSRDQVPFRAPRVNQKDNLGLVFAKQ